ncbi:MAG: helix-turn-helix transcriptional regulator [Clostridiales bacterium]|nr:helix-turn-helix transcriptional regulator [Clostridiales bacterium]
MDASELIGYNGKFATRLRKLMKDAKATQQDLAVAVGTTRQAISQYADGSVQPNIEKLFKIANYFKVSADYLLGWVDVKSNDIDIQAIHYKTGLSEESISSLMSETEFLCNITNRQNIDEAIEIFEQINAFANSQEDLQKETLSQFVKSLGCKEVFFDDDGKYMDWFTIIGYILDSETINLLMDNTYYKNFIEDKSVCSYEKFDSFTVMEALYHVLSYAVDENATNKQYAIAEFVDKFDDQTKEYVPYQIMSNKKNTLKSQQYFSLLLLNLQQALILRQDRYKK